MRGEEVWAQRIISLTLGVAVEEHDDGIAPSMHDLRIGQVDEPDRAVEVTGAVDQLWTQTWTPAPRARPSS